MKTEAAKNKQLVLEVLNWTELEYNTFLFDMGYRFLELEHEGNQEEIQQEVKKPSFWSWWKTNWAKRDVHFLEVLETTSLPAVYYRKINNPNTLTFSDMNEGLYRVYKAYRALKKKTAHV